MSHITHESNIDDVEGWENDLVDSFDFTMPGDDQSLGRDMAGDVALGIHERTVADRRDATGASVKSNEYHYAVWKAEKLGVYQPLIKTGQMLSLQSLLGDVDVGPDLVTMTYGTGDPPSGVSTPSGSLSKSDEKVTDRQKAEWNSEERPFFALDDRIAEALMDRASEAFSRLAQEKS